MARRVEVGAVDERVGVGRGLDAGVARAARVGLDRAAVEHRERLVELGRGRRVQQVAGDDRRVGPEPVDGAHGGREHLRAERLVRAEGRAEGAAGAVEERRPGRGLLVADVDVGELRERDQHLARAAAAADVRALGERLGRAGLERAVAVAVHERGAQRRARRRRGALVAAAAGRRRGEREQR